MIKISNNNNIIEVTVEDTLQSEDFQKLGTTADSLIEQYGKLKVLVNVAKFNGWENFNAAEEHFGFVKNHHQKVEKLAVVTGHLWQHWMAAMAQAFVHPEVKVFNENELEQAKKWING